MNTGDVEKVSVSTKIWKEQVPVVRSSKGYVCLEIHKDGDVQILESHWFNFFIQSWRTVVEALFGEDTGVVVPAVALWSHNKPFEIGNYEIADPFDGSGKVSAIFGVGRPGAIGADSWGKGLLKISEVSSISSEQYIKGSFEFICIDVDGVEVKVVAKEFWAKYRE